MDTDGLPLPFATLLRRYRQAAGLTQEELAERAHLSVRGITDLERGVRRTPHKDTVQLLATALALGPPERAAFESAARRHLMAQSPTPESLSRAPLMRTPLSPQRQAAPSRSTNLPLSLTSFVGRTREQATLQHALAETRLLTLTGAGGCGKTRLALQIAATLLPAYADGVWLIELAALSDPALVPQAVATVLGVRETSGQPLLTRLTAFLRPRRLLLLVDNCEHLIMACAELADVLLQACPHLTILATSRQALGIGGERPWTVPSLSLPNPHASPAAEQALASEAVQLFVQRASVIQPDFTPTDHNVALVVQVCRRLDGIPLALELAAARLASLSLERLAARLDDRFRLLTGGSRTALPRQQTLRATLDWSHDLLHASERLLFRRLSVFAGGWTLEAAEAICAGDDLAPDEVLDLLAGLIQQSLALLETTPTDHRYHMLETVRQYGHEQLVASGEAAPLRDRHLAWYLDMARGAEPWVGLPEQVTPDREGRAQVAWLERLEVEADNVRAALAWSSVADDRQEQGLRLAASIPVWWYMGGRAGEGRRRLEGLLTRGRAIPALLQAQALLTLCFLGWSQGEYADALRLAERATALFTREGHQRGALAARLHQGLQVLYVGDDVRATALFAEVLQAYRDLGDRRGAGHALLALGISLHMQADYGRAAALYTESLALFQEVGDTWGIGHQLANLASIARDLGDVTAAARLHRASLDVRRALMDRPGFAECFEGLAVCAARDGQPYRAARLFGAAEAIREAIGCPIDLVDRAAHEHTVPAVRAVLDESAFSAAWTEGHASSLEETIAYALAV